MTKLTAHDKKLARHYLAALDEGKAAYERADHVLQKLHARNPPGTIIQLADQLNIELVDNFANTNVSFKPAGVRRLDAKVNRPRKRRTS